ncbi:MAG: hypothetical protein R2712_12865 [Vicinamibacterales bacterium]
MMSALWRELARRDRALAMGGLLMAGGALACIVLMPLDGRTILGIDPWIKPAKFCVSIGVYFWTLAWFMGEADRGARVRLAVVRWTALVTLTGEAVLIAMQAARGTTSHFNDAMPFDAAVFRAMGAMIVGNTCAMPLFLTTLWRRIEPARAGYLLGIRLGIVLFVLGSLQGFMMVVQHAHSVPGPDGGAGLPLLNWSTTMGDLRPGHFLGLHALQVMPLAGALLDRAWATPAAVRQWTVVGFAVLWTVAWAALILQAMAGAPLLASLYNAS